MSSDQEPATRKKVKASKLCLDSDEQLRAQQSEEERRRRKQEKIQRKKEKEQERQRRQKEREQREREQEQEEEESEEEQLDYNILLLEDSNSHTSFTRVRNNIKEKFPAKKDYWEEKPVEKKPKKEKEKSKRVSNDNEHGNRDSDDGAPAAGSKSKHTGPSAKSTHKQTLVYEFAKRWWYALPNDWPPKDYDYGAQLEKQGYRIVPQQAFRKAPVVVNGLTKVHQLDGYRGIFKAEHKLIDVRPKEGCPSAQDFKKMSDEALVKQTIVALEHQMEQLNKVQYKQNGDEELMRELHEMLEKYRKM